MITAPKNEYREALANMVKDGATGNTASAIATYRKLEELLDIGDFLDKRDAEFMMRNIELRLSYMG